MKESLKLVMVIDEAVLARAYDYRDGVTAAFNLNVLHRLNSCKNLFR